MHAVIMKCLIDIATLYCTTGTDHQSATVDKLAEPHELVMQCMYLFCRLECHVGREVDVWICNKYGLGRDFAPVP